MPNSAGGESGYRARVGRTIWAPGRVNLIGEHTDTTGGLVLPMAIDLGITLTVEDPGPGAPPDRIELVSGAESEPLSLPLPVADPTAVTPPWGRYVAGVAARLGAATGFRGRLDSTLPLGAGLSSSAALEVAVALAMGGPEDPVELALLCRDAEEAASGVPCGVMDQLASIAGVDGHALLIDCHALTVTPVPVPADLAVTVVHSGQSRELAGSAYAERRAQCERAEAIIGPLRSASVDDVDRIDDEVVRRRARHVVTENQRVRDVVDALGRRDVEALGAAMLASHVSLRDDFEVSTPVLDALVDRLRATPGVHGARLTGAGFGGCAVAIHEPGLDLGGWQVRPSAGAHTTG